MDDDEIRVRLAQERTRLEALRRDVGGGSAGEDERHDLSELTMIDQHPAEIGTETFNREADESLLIAVRAELDQVDEAMRRLDAGTYGLCEACGRPIGDDRLEASPAARFCLEDEEAAELEARHHSTEDATGAYRRSEPAGADDT